MVVFKSNQILNVAVGVVFDLQQRVLITKRPHDVAHANQWEFPGGKIELNETPFEALCREMKEEVDLTIHSASLHLNITHAYPDQAVQLFIFYVKKFSGCAKSLVRQQELRWVEPHCLPDYSFPEANQVIIKALINPSLAPRKISSDIR